MPLKSNILPTEKQGLHIRNKHRHGYDFAKLIQCCPQLTSYVSVNKYGTTTIDFSNAEAVKLLNKALLQYFYYVSYWDIPANYLCPPIPGRADYLHYMADLLSECNGRIIPKGSAIHVLDIGVGANCVYPLIGNSEYGWHFVGTDIDALAVKSAKHIIVINNLTKTVECRLQKSRSDIYKGAIQMGELFDIAICNPPFHASLAAANAGTERKWKNLGVKKNASSALNFGGQNAELWCEGGELSFIKKMIVQSADLPTSCFWYSTLVSKSEHLQAIYHELNKVKVLDIKTIAMAQGQKQSRIVAWTFLSTQQQKEWAAKRWN